MPGRRGHDDDIRHLGARSQDASPVHESAERRNSHRHGAPAAFEQPYCGVVSARRRPDVGAVRCLRSFRPESVSSERSRPSDPGCLLG